MTSDLEMHKQLVRRLMDDAINGDNTSVLDQVCTRRFAAKLREWFAPFRDGFPAGVRKSRNCLPRVTPW